MFYWGLFIIYVQLKGGIDIQWEYSSLLRLIHWGIAYFGTGLSPSHFGEGCFLYILYIQ